MKNGRLIMTVSAVLAALFILTGCGALNDLAQFADSLAELLPAETSGGASGGADSDVIETDEAGHVIKLKHYDGDGKLIFTHVTTWENDRIKNRTSYNGKGEQTGSVDYEYDERGNCTVMSWYFWNSGALMKTERKYDEYDRLIEDIGHGTQNISTNRSVFEYDDKDGQHPKNYSKRTYWPSWPGERYSVSTYEYNEAGKLVKITTVNQDGELLNYDVYTYDANGRAEGYTDYDKDGKVNYSYKYIYDENGKKIKEERYNDKGELVGSDY